VKTSTTGPREEPELEIRERPPPTWNVDDGPPEGAEAEGPGASTINVKTSMIGPREVPEGAPTINVKTSTTGPREVLEPKVRKSPPSKWKRRRRAPRRCRSWRSERAHHQCENVDGEPPGGAWAEGPGAPTINVKTSTTGLREVLEIRERSACGARPSVRAVQMLKE
jgi:hypothetical protein